YNDNGATKHNSPSGKERQGFLGSAPSVEETDSLCTTPEEFWSTVSIITPPVVKARSFKWFLTGRRKLDFVMNQQRLSLGDCWMLYNGEKTVDPRFMVRRHVDLRNSKALATLMNEIKGSYAQRCVSVPKETAYGVALGADVFSLITVGSSHMETTVAMALVILLEQMFGSLSHE
ncbi:hypothetical protein V2J09_022261, partial [Rumex salicifolius]